MVEVCVDEKPVLVAGAVVGGMSSSTLPTRLPRMFAAEIMNFNTRQLEHHLNLPTSNANDANANSNELHRHLINELLAP